MSTRRRLVLTDVHEPLNDGEAIERREVVSADDEPGQRGGAAERWDRRSVDRWLIRAKGIKGRERRFALRITTAAARMAAAHGVVEEVQRFAWLLLVGATHKRKHGKGRV